MVFTPSEYQQRIFDFIQNGTGHGIVGAVAGSGKSETVKQGVIGYIPKTMRVCVCAYNTHIQVELRAKFPAYVDVVTNHSMGKSLLNRYGFGKKVDQNKVHDIAVNDIRQEHPELSRIKRERKSIHADVEPTANYVSRVVSSMKNLCIKHPTIEDITYVMEQYGIEYPKYMHESKHLGMKRLYNRDDVHELVLRVYKESILEVNVIDFDDMIFLPYVLGIRLGMYDYLFVDETQDLNRAQRDLVMGAIKPTGRIIAVGDQNQSMYAFRGADPRSMDAFKESLNATELPLSITYRCPKSHVRMAQRLVPTITAAEWAHEGTIDEMSEDEYIRQAEPGSLTVCRFNAPIMAAAIDFILMGKKAVIKGKDLQGTIKGILDQFTDRNLDMDVSEMMENAEAWEKKKVAKCELDGTDPVKYTDRIDMLRAIAGRLNARKVSEIYTFIDKVFSKTDAQDGSEIMLSTVHGAKGLEAEHVYILGINKMPHFHIGQTETDREQEKNILYVALTRSRDRMTMIDLQ